MDSTSYYVAEGEQKVGPFDSLTLQTMRDEGRLSRETLVWRDGMTDWQSASSFLPQLFPADSVLAPSDLYVATAGQRILIGLIDACILFIPMQFIIVPVATATVGAGLLLEFVYPFVNALYGALLISSSLQGSVGMKLLGFKVVDYAGRPPTPGQVWGRSIGSIISWVALGIGILFVFFTPRRQTLHDLMAATLVVKTTPNG